MLRLLIPGNASGAFRDGNFLGCSSIFYQKRGLTSRDLKTFSQGKTGCGCGVQFCFELPIVHMAARFSQQYLRAGFRSPGDFRKELCCVRELMHHREGESEVNFAVEIGDAHRFGRADARIDPILQILFRRAPLQTCDHSWLEIDRDHVSCGSHELRHGNREESHARTGLQHGYALPNIRSENRDGILPEPAAYRTCQKITKPPRTNTMRHMKFSIADCNYRVQNVVLRHFGIGT